MKKITFLNQNKQKKRTHRHLKEVKDFFKIIYKNHQQIELSNDFKFAIIFLVDTSKLKIFFNINLRKSKKSLKKRNHQKIEKCLN